MPQYSMTAKTLLILTTFSIGSMGTASVAEGPRAPSDAGADAPALAELGGFQVGTTTQDLNLGPRPQFIVAGPDTGKSETPDRIVPVRYWYPAAVTGTTQTVNYPQNRFLQNGKVFQYTAPGIAFADAAPLADQKFPLFVLSHGLGGENVAMTYLAENIASKGYVVASLGHNDIPAVEGASLPLAFGNLLINRSLDQQGVINALVSDSGDADHRIRTVVDRDKVGLLGYSMGGYGALTTAGAELSPESNSFFGIPQHLRDIFVAKESAVQNDIDALILVAPWGGSKALRTWNEEAIGSVTAPTLVIAGDHDDVVDYEGGIKWLFETLGSAERHMLVYNNARHNIAYNPVSHALSESDNVGYDTLDTLTDPVWRGERLNGINQHFITAFLGLHLKGDTSMGAYLDVPTVKASAGKWPLPAGVQTVNTAATEEQPDHWMGFYRRRAVGLELHHGKAK